MIQLFDIKTRNLGFAFCQPPKKSLPKSLTQKKSLQNFKSKKSPQIANFKPKKGLRTSPSLIYLSTPPPPWDEQYLFSEDSQQQRQSLPPVMLIYRYIIRVEIQTNKEKDRIETKGLVFYVKQACIPAQLRICCSKLPYFMGCISNRSVSQR